VPTAGDGAGDGKSPALFCADAKASRSIGRPPQGGTQGATGRPRMASDETDPRRAVKPPRRGSTVRPERRTAALLPERLLDVPEAATLLGLKSPRTLYKWAYAGRVPSVKIGRLLRFRRSDLERLIASGERPAFAAPNVFPSTPAALGQ